MDNIDDLNKKISLELSAVKNNTSNDINKVKQIKNDLYLKTSSIFIHNLKLLITIESTQKKLANKIGISEDLLSKYKSGAAFPSIETLLYISEIYNISLNKFLSEPLNYTDIYKTEEYNDIFEEKYYAYFFVTNIAKEGAIHESILNFKDRNVNFNILVNGHIIKSFDGMYNDSGRIISIELKSLEDGNAYINMIKPNLNKRKYVGGVALLLLPSDANSKPCCQKIIISKYKIDINMYHSNVENLLQFHNQEQNFDNIKLSVADDENVYNFLQSTFS